MSPRSQGDIISRDNQKNDTNQVLKGLPSKLTGLLVVQSHY